MFPRRPVNSGKTAGKATLPELNQLQCMQNDKKRKYQRLKNRVQTKFKSRQSKAPTRVGRRKAAPVHFQLPVSFFMVRQVVPQGKWNRQRIMGKKHSRNCMYLRSVLQIGYGR